MNSIIEGGKVGSTLVRQLSAEGYDFTITARIRNPKYAEPGPSMQLRPGRNDRIVGM